MERKTLIKQRLAVFLSMVMVLTMLSGITPQMQTTVQAAATNLSISSEARCNSVKMGKNYQRVYGFMVEEKQTVQLKQMFYAYDSGSWKSYLLQDLKGVKYSLNKTGAASLSRQGELKTKKPGIVQGTVSYGGSKTYFVCKIVKTGKLGTNKAAYKTIHKLFKEMGTFQDKITAKNCYKYLSTYQKIRKECDKLDDIDEYGMLYTGYVKGTEKVKIGNYTLKNWEMSQLPLPEMLAYNTYEKTIDTYVKNHNAVGTVSAKQFKIKSVLAKKNTRDMTITVSTKAKQPQIFAIKGHYAKDIVLENDKTAVFPVYVKDQGTGAVYRGEAVAHEGSNKISIQMDYMKFTANHKYQLVSAMYRSELSSQSPDPLSYDWTRRRAVKVK